MIEKVRPVKEVSLRLTILSVENGKTYLFSNKDFDSSSVRVAVSRINEEGHGFTTSIKGANKKGIHVTNNSK